MFLVMYERFEPLASGHAFIWQFMPIAIARFMPYALVDAMPLVLLVVAIGVLQKMALQDKTKDGAARQEKLRSLTSLLKLAQSAELYHYLRWLLVAMVVPMAFSCASLSVQATLVCAKRPRQEEECTLLSFTDFVRSLFNMVKEHYLLLLFLNFGQSILKYGKGVVIDPVVKRVKKVFDDQKQAEKFKNNDFDASRLNVSLNMLRKDLDAEAENDLSSMRSEPDDDGNNVPTPIEKKKLEFATLLEEPLETVIPDKYVRDTVIAAAKKTTDNYAFLHTLVTDLGTYRRMLAYILNRISQEFNSRMLCYDQVRPRLAEHGHAPR